MCSQLSVSLHPATQLTTHLQMASPPRAQPKPSHATWSTSTTVSNRSSIPLSDRLSNQSFAKPRPCIFYCWKLTKSTCTLLLPRRVKNHTGTYNYITDVQNTFRTLTVHLKKFKSCLCLYLWISHDILTEQFSQDLSLSSAQVMSKKYQPQ